MRLRLAGTLAAASLLLFVRPGLSQEPPPAPAGFAWKKIDSVKAAFLMPNGWFFKEEKNDKLLSAFFITRENIDKAGMFETGLTVNVQTVKQNAQETAARFIAGIMQANEMLDFYETETGVLKGYGCRVRKTEKDHAPLIMNVLGIGNSRTQTVYILIFESPEATWDEAWKKGETTLKYFLLDDEI
jgi:hypothetical protein